MDILTTKKLDLAEFGLSGFLEFSIMDIDELRDWGSKVEQFEKEGQENASVVDGMIDLVKRHFIKGEITENGEKKEFTTLGRIDATVASASFLLISGGVNDKKK